MKCRAILPVVLVVAVLGLLAGALPAGAQSERILNFKSVVVVHPDASMTVTEDITVKATGREIKEGIVRDFPTTFRDRQGKTVTVGFEVQAVLRDGQTEPYHIQSAANGVRIYIGQKPVFLRPGVYTYTIKYRVDRKLEFLKDFDELYWNVTGNGWTFPIDRAKAVIVLPGGEIYGYVAYTGYHGERGKDVRVKHGDHGIFFTTTRGLAPKEGLTIAVAWSKGVVHEPSVQNKVWFFLRDHQPWAAPATAQSERILNFKSVVVVHPDTSMTVTEDITVKANGRKANYGIVRDFPTTYRDRQGNTVTVGFELEEVLRDGDSVPYDTQPAANRVKIYIGKPGGPPGVYTYTIKYRVDRKLEFFKEFDELYWNVTGNLRTFPIDRAEVVVKLPPGAKILRSAAYTGYYGDYEKAGQDVTVKPGDRNIVFTTTRGLTPREELTIAVAWPKGVVHEPRILNFKSVGVVHPDASMTVTEDITVKTTRHEISYGIVRDFPTNYQDRQGNTVTVGFEVQAVLRDGQTEPYHIQSAANGVRIYIGQKQVFLPPGVYTYTIKYRVDRKLDFFKEFDELSWNVTGNGWTFPTKYARSMVKVGWTLPIDRTEAVIKLPPGAKILRSDAYTGKNGERRHDVTVNPGDRDIVFTTTRGLAPREELTIAVAWPKGVVHEPDNQASPGAAPATAQSKRILNFKSVGVVHPDASMTVTEDIMVKATKRERIYSIVRDFPTTYRDRRGRTVTVGFELKEVLRDGDSVPYSTERAANGVKIEIEYPPPGVYNYTIKYHVDQALGFFQDFDQLFWNVTGNGWTFPIDRAQAVIQLPPGAKILRSAAYTGNNEERALDVTVKPGDRDIVFTTTRGLAPKEGLTIAVALPKGVVHEPSVQKKVWFFLRYKLDEMTVGFVCLSLLLGFYLWTWRRVGRDPAPGTIIPLFSPPRGLSPAAVRFVSRMGFDDKTFAVALVDMAVKGAVQIQEDGRDYTLVRRDALQAPLSRGEQLIAARLFIGGGSIKLVNENHTRIKSAIDALKKNLNTELEKIYVATN
jgi:hypothetical protein